MQSKMADILTKLKHEIVEAIPPAIFFFVAFQVIGFTHMLTLGQIGLEWSMFIKATIAALVIAKVVLIVDLMPFVNRFPEKPLIYNVLWKTGIYISATIAVRVLEELIPMIPEAGSIGAALDKLHGEVAWYRFWAVQIWLLLLFTVYCSLREFGRVIGRQKVIEMYFRRGTHQQH